MLAGLIGALLAAGLDPYDAASVGSWLHGAAADRWPSRGWPARPRGDVASRTLPELLVRETLHRLGWKTLTP